MPKCVINAANAPTPWAHPLAIGSLTLNSRVFQSPLSGVTDRVFRRLVRRYAPDSLLFTEMVSATEIHHLHQLPQVMDLDPAESPIAIQLFDCRPDFMAEAARKAVDQGAQLIDINMGCPVNKITKKGGGSSLLREPDVAVAIVKTVVGAVSVPVTVKTRLGWDDQSIAIIDFAQRLQEAGASLLTLHGRTRAQGYQGPARWEWIGRVKQALQIPVIANGIWHRWQVSRNGSWFARWENLYGDGSSAPAATRTQDGRLVVFVRGADNGVWHRWQTTRNGNWG